MLKNKKIFISIFVVILLFLPNILLGVYFGSFDKYKFVEEWHKMFYQIIATLFFVDYYTQKSAQYRYKIKINRLISDQLKYANIILNSIDKLDKLTFMNTLEAFYIVHKKLQENRVYPYSILINDINIVEDIQLILLNKEDFCFNSKVYSAAIINIKKGCEHCKKMLCKERQRDIDTFSIV